MAKQLSVALAGALTLAGCATSAEVIPLGDGAYSVTAGSHTMGSNGLGDVHQVAFQKATTYCNGKKVAVTKFDDSVGINTYATTLTFRCE